MHSQNLAKAIRSLMVFAAVAFFHTTYASEKVTCILTKPEINRFFYLNGSGKEFFSYDEGHEFVLEKTNKYLYARRIMNGKVAALESTGTVKFIEVPFQQGLIYLDKNSQCDIFTEIGSKNSDISRKHGRLSILQDEQKPEYDIASRYFLRQYREGGYLKFQIINLESFQIVKNEHLKNVFDFPGYATYMESTTDKLYLMFKENKSIPRFGVVVYDTTTWKVLFKKLFIVSNDLKEKSKIYPHIINIQNNSVYVVRYIQSPFFIKKNWLLEFSLDNDEVRAIKLKQRGELSYQFFAMEKEACTKSGGDFL